MASDFQKEKFARFFQILDFNGNGIIEKDDFTGIAENLCVFWDIKEGSDAYNNVLKKYKEGWYSFDKFVKGRNGVADRDHWVEFACNTLKTMDKAEFKQLVISFVNGIFSNFDIDKDGTISLDEFVDFFVAHRIEVQYSAKVFTKIDVNQDGDISRGEFCKAIAEFFLSNNPKDAGNFLFGYTN